MRKLIFILLFIPFILSGQTTYYFAPDGDDSNPGTLAEPKKSPSVAPRLVTNPGDSIIFRGGRYDADSVIYIDPELYGIGASGTRANHIFFGGYAPDVAAGNPPYFDCRNRVNTYGFDNGKYNHGIEIGHVEWWDFKDFHITRVYQLDSLLAGGITSSYARYLTFENIALDTCSQRGFYIRSGAWKSFYDDGFTEVVPYFNTEDDTTRFINCDANNLCDSLTDNNGYDPGNGADGWKCDIYHGNVFIFTNCRAWYYTDDGMDLSNINRGQYLIDGCWVMPSNKFTAWLATKGDSPEANGISKMNAQNPDYYDANDDTTSVMFRVVNNIAIWGKYGYVFNLFGMNVDRKDCYGIAYNNLAMWNTVRGFYYNGRAQVKSRGRFFNNLAYDNTAPFDFRTENPDSIIESHNTHDKTGVNWDVTDSVTVTEADFYYDITDSSLIDAMFTASRGVDGSLPDNPFRLAEESDLINAGIIPHEVDSVSNYIIYYGEFPDIGPYEFGAAENQDTTKAITSFTCPNQRSTAVINTTAHTVSIIVGGSKTNITPTIIHNGASIDKSGAQDFTNPVTYTVTAEDESTQEWVVTVTARNIGIDGSGNRYQMPDGSYIYIDQ